MDMYSLGQAALLMVWLATGILPFFIRPAHLPNRYGGQREAVGFVQAVRVGFRKAFDYKGRASRSEYWWYLAAFLSVYFTAEMIEEAFDVSWFHVASVIFIVPYFAVAARRLHDLNRSGWWQLMGLGVGLFVMFFLLAEPAAEAEREREEIRL